MAKFYDKGSLFEILRFIFIYCYIEYYTIPYEVMVNYWTHESSTTFIGSQYNISKILVNS